MYLYICYSILNFKQTVFVKNLIFGESLVINSVPTANQETMRKDRGNTVNKLWKKHFFKAGREGKKFLKTTR
jgi:hypothetical protein